MPNKISSNKAEIIYLELEKSRISREKAKLVLDKSMALYVVFLLVAVLGFVFKYIDHVILNVLVVLGICVLVLGSIPYLIVVYNEEKKIKDWLEGLKSSHTTK